ncbi:MAG: hypothetical protein LUH06_00420 [Oscillospiraceae bacterium]|nr:hypothetical protein [Oscillospiraceae bacterium]
MGKPPFRSAHDSCGVLRRVCADSAAARMRLTDLTIHAEDAFVQIFPWKYKILS